MNIPPSAFRKRIVFCYLAAVGGLLLMVILMAIFRSGYQPSYGLKRYSDVRGSWTYENGEAADLSSLKKENTGPVSIFFQIPQMDGNESLVYWSQNVYTKVLLDGEIIYETDVMNSDRYPGSRWNIVTFGPDQAGRTIQLQVAAGYDNENLTLNNVYWGDRAAIIMAMFGRKLVALLVSMTICLVGIFMIALDISINYGKARKNHGLRCLGFFALCIGIWCLIETGILQFVIRDALILQAIDNIMLILSVLPMLLYADCTYGIFRYRILRVFCVLQLIYLLFCIVIPAAGMLDWHSLLPVARLFMAVCACVFIVGVIRANVMLYRKGSRAYAAYLQLVGIGALGVSVVLELVRFKAVDSSDNALVLRFGLLIFIICFAISSQFRTYKLITQGMEYANVHKLAYSDVMTQLGNRMAYMEQLRECVGQHTPKLGIVFMDVNNLKKVNDAYGHEEGDALIRMAAEVIRKSFGDYGRIYRIGGDEFCVLMDTNPEESYAMAKDEFQKLIHQINDSGEYPYRLQIAHGFAWCEADSMVTVEDAVKSADDKMYQNKVQLKKAAEKNEHSTV